PIYLPWCRIRARIAETGMQFCLWHHVDHDMSFLWCDRAHSLVGRSLLHDPAVPIWIVEENERVPASAGTVHPFPGAAHIHVPNRADVDATLQELRPRRIDIRHNQLRALDATWLHVDHAQRHRDRAPRTRRRPPH